MPYEALTAFDNFSVGDTVDTDGWSSKAIKRMVLAGDLAWVSSTGATGNLLASTQLTNVGNPASTTAGKFGEEIEFTLTSTRNVFVHSHFYGHEAGTGADIDIVYTDDNWTSTYLTWPALSGDPDYSPNPVNFASKLRLETSVSQFDSLVGPALSVQLPAGTYKFALNKQDTEQTTMFETGSFLYAIDAGPVA